MARRVAMHDSLLTPVWGPNAISRSRVTTQSDARFRISSQITRYPTCPVDHLQTSEFLLKIPFSEVGPNHQRVDSSESSCPSELPDNLNTRFFGGREGCSMKLFWTAPVCPSARLQTGTPLSTCLCQVDMHHFGTLRRNMDGRLWDLNGSSNERQHALNSTGFGMTKTATR